MADKLQKFLSKLPRNQREKLEPVLQQLYSGGTTHLDVKALSGKPHLYRARVGRIRVIFYRDDSRFELRRVTNRDDKTYKDI